ncbi:MAG: HNH endonuclease [Bacteroidales bacterium]|nr:HNH endonuclease [Bacteroidales bacterium]
MLLFRKSFENTLCPELAWFGIHSTSMSLVVGGVYLTAIQRVASGRGLWMLQNADSPQVAGLSYRPVKSSRDPRHPLLWAYAESLHIIPELVDEDLLWESFRAASKLAPTELRSAAARDAIQKNRGKRRLCEFWPMTGNHPIDSEEITRIFGQLPYSIDVRSPPDHHRRRNFRSGWADATTRGKAYRASTLVRLTWHNLGYRFGKSVGPRPLEHIDAVYDELARQYGAAEPPRRTSIVPSGPESAWEGRKILRQHRLSERNRRLVKQKKKLVLDARGCLACEVCGFDFAQTYGERGCQFAECHHIHPIAQATEERRTHLDDLALVCANCHRMLHRPPWMSLDALRELVRLQRNG